MIAINGAVVLLVLAVVAVVAVTFIQESAKNYEQEQEQDK